MLFGGDLTEWDQEYDDFSGIKQPQFELACSTNLALPALGQWWLSEGQTTRSGVRKGRVTTRLGQREVFNRLTQDWRLTPQEFAHPPTVGSPFNAIAFPLNGKVPNILSKFTAEIDALREW